MNADDENSMKCVILNGSPKGDVSVTMQYIAYIRKKFPEHTYEILNVAHEIKTIEKDTAAWNRILEIIRSADLVLWAFPLYYLLVCAQYKRFIELVFERNAQDAFTGTYAAGLSTSIHFFDQTAHAYIHAVSDDLGMNYLGFYSAEMGDLLKEEERTRLEKFTRFLITAVEDTIPVQRETPPLVRSSLVYAPGLPGKPVSFGTKKVVILTDDDGSSPSLAAMTDRLTRTISGSAELINLHDVNIRGGCLGCCQCGYDNTCVYTDGYIEFFKTRLVPADIIILAGSVHDRYLSSAWKQFFDRSFFKGHTPGLEGKQLGFVIAGPLSQIACLKEALVAWADNGGCHAQLVTDEVPDSAKLDALLDTLTLRLVRDAEAGYIPPRTFYAVGGHKIFRDSIYGGMRMAFQADYRYYQEHGMFDFPQADVKTRLLNAILIPLTRLPGFRKKMFSNMKYHMIERFGPVLRDAQSS
jgi:multimeric flavodoxin WrbA